MSPTIFFDFDGTLALGDGPITAFAREISARMNDAEFIDRADAALAAFASGEHSYRDGYDAVTSVALAEGVDRDVIGASYNASRAILGSDGAAVAPPSGLAEFFERVGAQANLELATNAPGSGVVAVLESWGVADVFDAMHFSVGKPEGLEPVLTAALDRGPVLSIGDIFEFDLAPASRLGADTALVGATASSSAVATTMRGASLADLYDEIIAWVAASTSSSAIPNTTSPERSN
ncbi:HAD family hydrolase [Microbacterium sp. NPDC076911]|uniref:HAD family hydrolase n=1 Tax=Microbacterium sp. NPDC076911 TaxID=3154958 RepID=UPI003443392E